MVDIEVIGLKSKVQLRALIDTGFTGYLSIPARIAKNLGLVLIDEEKYELANGDWITQFKFQGKVHFLHQTQEVEILVSNSDTTTIGTLLLLDCRMTIDFRKNSVRLTRVKT